MRVALLVLEDYPGSENRVQRQAAALLEAGHEVVVFAASGPSTQSEFRGVRIERSSLRREKRSSTVQRMKEYALFPIAAALWCRRLREWHPDVVQAANPPDWLIKSVRFAGHSVKAVLDVHDPMPELAESQGKSSASIRVLKSLEGWCVKHADLVIAPTPYVCDVLAARHQVRAYPVLNAVDDSVFPKAEPRLERSVGPLSICYHGTLSERFGVHVAIDAVALARDAGCEVTLDIYGDGDARCDLERQVATRGVQHVVRFHGQVPAASLADLLRAHDVGLIPYEDSVFMRLAYSTKAFEYAMLGLPVVASDLPPIRDQLGDHGASYVPPGDPQELADALVRIAGRWEGAYAAAHAAQATLVGFTWDRWKGEYVSLIEGLR